MSVKQQLAAAIEMLPESVTLEEAVERLYQAFKLKQAHGALAGTAQSGPSQAGSRQPTLEIALGLLATSKASPPSDDEVAAWLDEHRMRK